MEILKMKYLVLLFALLSGVSAVAQNSPVDGFWWNPDESGRGVALEMQDDVMVLALYGYAPNGDNQWYLAVGSYNSAQKEFSGQWDSFAGGQCLGCSYVGPVYQPGAGGSVRMVFDTDISATLYFNGGSTRLVRQYWFNDSVNDFSLGSWMITTGLNLGLLSNYWINLDDKFINDGDEFVSGYQVVLPSQLVVGGYKSDLGLFTMLVDSSTDYYRFFTFANIKDRMFGLSWLYRKTESLAGSGYDFVAYRWASRSYVQSGQGPHDKKTSVPTSRNEADQLEWLAQQADQSNKSKRFYHIGDKAIPASWLIEQANLLEQKMVQSPSH